MISRIDGEGYEVVVSVTEGSYGFNLTFLCIIHTYIHTHTNLHGTDTNNAIDTKIHTYIDGY
tara:strand:+ start:223 stop:408 length:186 start_codon:yes stop_codon:yes gene_type:complete